MLVRCGLVLALFSAAAGARQAPPTLASVHDLLERGHYAEAEAAAEQLLAGSPADDHERARSLVAWVESRLRNGRGSQPPTRAYALQALALHPSAGAARAVALRQLAEIELASGRADRALPLARDAVRSSEAAGEDPEVLLTALATLARALIDRTQDGEAGSVLARALSLADSTPHLPAVEHAELLLHASAHARRAGDFATARAYQTRAGAFVDSLAEPHPTAASVLAAHGNLLWLEGNYIESSRYQREAVATARASLRSDHPLIATYRADLATSLWSLGSADAQAELEEAIALATTALGPDHPDLAQFLSVLAAVQDTNPVESRRTLQRALDIRERALGPQDPSLTRIIFSLGVVAFDLGDYMEARRAYEDAVARWSRDFGPEHRHVGRGLSALAEAMDALGLRTEAARLYDRALALRRRALGDRHVEVAETLLALARLEFRAGNIRSAEARLDDALAMWREAGVRDQLYAQALALSGDLRLQRSDADGAAREYEQALTVSRDLFGGAHMYVADLETRLALASVRARVTTGVVARVLGAAATTRDHLRASVAALAERQALALAAASPRPLDLALSLLAGADAEARAAISRIADELVRSRAIVLDELATRLIAGVAGSDGRDRAALALARQRLAALVVKGPEGRQAADYRSALDDARRAKERAEQQLAERSTSLRSQIALRGAGIEQVQRAIPPDGVLVSYVRYRRVSFADNSSENAYAAFVHRPQGPPVFVPLGKASRIDALIDTWRWHLSDPRRAARNTGVAARAAIWDPIAAHLEGARLVLIVPDGALNLVPFAALPSGSSSYLVEKEAKIQYLSAERDLAAPRDTRPTGGLLVAGGPSFGRGSASSQSTRAFTRASCGAFQAMRFAPLPAARGEAEDVAALWSGADVELLTGAAATEQAVKRQASGRRILHLATHGFFLGNCPSALAGTRAVGGIAAARAPLPPGLDNPLLLSGLAFARANNRARTIAGEDDGILTAEEVGGLDLTGVEWAVLSACDTGAGEIRNGEGVLGLRRAFQMAGARTVIMSLWSVEDRSARAWMGALYNARLRRNLDTAAAVQEAALAVLTSRRAKGLGTHPFFWAGFVAAGDWR